MDFEAILKHIDGLRSSGESEWAKGVNAGIDNAMVALRHRFSASTASAITDEQIVKAVRPHLVFNDGPDGNNSTNDVLKAVRAVLALAAPTAQPTVQTYSKRLTVEENAILQAAIWDSAEIVHPRPVAAVEPSQPAAEANVLREKVIEEARFIANGRGLRELLDAVEAYALASRTPAPAAPEDAKDAARYRWLCQGDNDELVLQRYRYPAVCKSGATMFLPRKKALDAAIDAAIASSSERTRS